MVQITTIFKKSTFNMISKKTKINMINPKHGFCLDNGNLSKKWSIFQIEVWFSRYGFSQTTCKTHILWFFSKLQFFFLILGILLHSLLNGFYVYKVLKGLKKGQLSITLCEEISLLYCREIWSYNYNFLNLISIKRVDVLIHCVWLPPKLYEPLYPCMLGDTIPSQYGMYWITFI